MNEITEILADQIIDPIEPMRGELDRDAIFELSESIKQRGLIQPITVRKSGEKYEVVAGHRRFRACMMAAVVRIPCIVRELSDDAMVEVRAHENLFRQDLDPVEEAVYIGKLVGENEENIPIIAKRMNKSIAWVEDRLDILQYPDYFLPALKEKRISLGVAKHLAKIGDESYRRMFFDQAVSNGLAVWQAEYYLKQWEGGIFAPGETIMPPERDSSGEPQTAISAPCARCEQKATAPNLKTVFIHIECPVDNEATA